MNGAAWIWGKDMFCLWWTLTGNTCEWLGNWVIYYSFCRKNMSVPPRSSTCWFLTCTWRNQNVTKCGESSQGWLSGGQKHKSLPNSKNVHDSVSRTRTPIRFGWGTSGINVDVSRWKQNEGQTLTQRVTRRPPSKFIPNSCCIWSFKQSRKYGFWYVTQSSAQDLRNRSDTSAALSQHTNCH